MVLEPLVLELFVIMKRKTLLTPIALASTYGAAITRKSSEFRQGYTPDWPTRAADEVVQIESRIAEAEVAMFSDYYSFVGRDERGWVAFAIDNNRQRAVDYYEADHATFMYDGETGFVDIAGYGKYDTADHTLLHVPDSASFTFERDQTQTVMQSMTEDLILSFGELDAHFHDSRPEASILMGIAPATLSWRGRELTGDIIGERLGFKNFDRRKMGPMLAKQTLSSRSFQGLYLTTEHGEIIYLRASTMQLGLIDGPSAIGFGRHDDYSGMLNSVTVTADRWQPGPGLFSLPSSWTATWWTDREYKLTLSTIDTKVYSNWGLGAFAMSFAEGTITNPDGSRAKVAGFAELIIP